MSIDEDSMIMKGWGTILYENNTNEKFEISFNDMNSLKSGLDKDSFFTDYGLIIVPEVNISNIFNCIKKLSSTAFFSTLVPVDENRLIQLGFYEETNYYLSLQEEDLKFQKE
jgi:hypothetical protein